MSTDTRISRIQEWGRGERPGPWSITLFPTNKCNLPCEHCWLRWGEYDRTYESEMPDERLLELVDEAAELGVRDWTLVGGGDPMVRGKTVVAMCKRIREHGMDGMLHTNGTLFRAGQLEELVEMDWGRVAISLDGPTAELNNTIRGYGFEKAVANMKKLAALKQERGVTRPGVSIHSVITNLNYDRLNELVDLAVESGCDMVNLTLLLVESDGCKPFALTDAQKFALRDHVRRAVTHARERGIANNFEIFLKDEVIADSTHMNPEAQARPTSGIASTMCFEPLSALTIQPDGRTGPCCVFWDPSANSVKTTSLRDVWYGPYLEEVRAGFQANQPKAYCANCSSSLYARIEQTRSELLLAEAGMPERFKRLVRRGAGSLRSDGVAATLRKGARWARRQLVKS